MSLPVILRPEAQDDLLAARDWYERQRPSLGTAFTDAVQQFLSRIEMLPDLYAVMLKNVRCGKVKRFPYLVYYRVKANYIEIVAILHGSRNPQVWQDRV